jgi:hypothetical protein
VNQWGQKQLRMATPAEKQPINNPTDPRFLAIFTFTAIRKALYEKEVDVCI